MHARTRAHAPLPPLFDSAAPLSPRAPRKVMPRPPSLARAADHRTALTAVTVGTTLSVRPNPPQPLRAPPSVRPSPLRARRACVLDALKCAARRALRTRQACSANTFNQVWGTVPDGKMKRTVRRPMPSGTCLAPLPPAARARPQPVALLHCVHLRAACAGAVDDAGRRRRRRRCAPRDKTQQMPAMRSRRPLPRPQLVSVSSALPPRLPSGGQSQSFCDRPVPRGARPQAASARRTRWRSASARAAWARASWPSGPTRSPRACTPLRTQSPPVVNTSRVWQSSDRSPGLLAGYLPQAYGRGAP